VAETITKAERSAYIEKLRLDDAIRDHADKLIDAWTNAGGPRHPLSRAYELLHPGSVRQAIVEWCLEFAREYHPGTIRNPTDERHVARLFREGKFDLPELPYLLRFLNSWTLVALQQGLLLAWALDKNGVAFGKHRRIATARWQNLQPDFKQGTASVDGETIIYGVEVEVANTATKPPRPPLASRAAVEKWFVDYTRESEAAGKRPDQVVAWAAAQKEFPGFTDRDWFRAMRQAHKPPDWPKGPGNPGKLARKIGG
jgi:hypothetical protein